jgi:hypothetical protein
MYRACSHYFSTSLRITWRRASSRFIEIFSPDWRTTSRSGPISPKKTILALEITNPLGLGPGAGPKSVYSTQGGSGSPHRKTSLG